MNWENLKQGKCPKCEGKMNIGMLDFIYCCPACSFSIGKEKFGKIIGTKSRTTTVDEYEDNQSQLNNL